MSKIYDDPDYWFGGTFLKTKKSKSSGGVAKLPIPRKSYAGKKNTANAIKAINAKIPQVVVKISGSSKGANKAQAHANYIGRNGKVEIEDQDGNIYKGNEQKTLLGAWEAQGMHDRHETGSRREAFHFVFSMPNGTNPEAMKKAVVNLVNEEFDGHQYFLAQHLDTDSPHVHVLVNASNDKGERLNPRKQDLHNYRVNFVRKLAEQGIQATATRRLHRFKYQDSYRQSKLHENKRKGKSEPILNKPTPKQMREIQKTHTQIAKKYQEYVKTLPADQIQLKREVDKLLKSSTLNTEKGR